MENLSVILACIFGSTSVLGLVTTIIFWKKFKRTKEAETIKTESEASQSVSEAEQAFIETQKQKIELGNKYMEDTLKMVELVKQALDRSDGNQEKMLDQLNLVQELIHKLSQQTDSQELLLQLIVKYLNGNFQEFIEDLKKQGLLDPGFVTRKKQELESIEIPNLFSEHGTED